MSTGAIVGVVIAVVVVVLVGVVAVWMLSRGRRLRERFGPEYDRTVQERGSRFAAERELRVRQERHERMDLRSLPPAACEQYAHEWTAVQERFIDSPGAAVDEAEVLVTRLMNDRGYPTEGYGQQVWDLSVEHGRAVDHYRSAHEIHTRAGTDDVGTEDLREALVHYRAVFDDLLTSGDRSRTPSQRAK